MAYTKKKVEEKLKSKIWHVPAQTENTTWDQWYERANKTAEINYGCKFKDGICKTVAAYGSHSKPTLYTCGCCCSDCANTLGYLDSVEEKNIKTYVKLWSSKTGFFKKECGCVLPRHLRSFTCLVYSCRPLTFHKKLYGYLKGISSFERLSK